MQSQTDYGRQLLIAELAGTILGIVQKRRHSATQRILARIRAEWQGRSDTQRPWGFWVREYDPIPADADDLNFQAFPNRVWFVDGFKVRQENPWKWMRFVAARRLAPIASTGRFFPIGLAAFAPYSGSDDYYVELLWGGLWGEAWRLSMRPDGQLKSEGSGPIASDKPGPIRLV